MVYQWWRIGKYLCFKFVGPRTPWATDDELTPKSHTSMMNNGVRSVYTAQVQTPGRLTPNHLLHTSRPTLLRGCQSMPLVTTVTDAAFIDDLWEVVVPFLKIRRSWKLNQSEVNKLTENTSDKMCDIIKYLLIILSLELISLISGVRGEEGNFIYPLIHKGRKRAEVTFPVLGRIFYSGGQSWIECFKMAGTVGKWLFICR